MTAQGSLPSSDRALLPDLIRVWALFGIALMNVPNIAEPLHLSPLDTYSEALVFAVFRAKSYALFSLMFGASLFYQIAAAERAGKSTHARHARRMIGLFIFGALHAAFFYTGDILIMYSVLGAILYAFRDAHARFLFSFGAVCIIAQTLLHLFFAAVALSIESDPAGFSDYTDKIALAAERQGDLIANGSFIEVSLDRASQIPVLLANILFQSLDVFGCFLIGMATAKRGALSYPQAHYWKLCRRYALPIGLFGSCAATLIYQFSDYDLSSTAWVSTAIFTLTSPLMALGIAGLIALYASLPTSPAQQFLARAGGASLSVYILQSAIFSFLFTGYGLGYYGQLSTSATLLVGAGVGIASITLVSLWRARFARGPLEILLRRWTYLE